MTAAEKRSEVRKVRSYIKTAGNVINDLGIYARVEQRYPFDVIALATISKVLALARACLALCEDFPDEAYGLTRSIVECATNLRFLTSDVDLQDSRTREFVKYALADKAFWAYNALQQFAGRPEEVEIREYLEREGITPDPKAARRHWSGVSGFIWDVMIVDHPLDGPVTQALRKTSYAIDYFQTSGFVHCSLPAIDNYFVDSNTRYRISRSSELHETFQSTLFLVLIYVHTAIAYSFFGMRSDRPAQLTVAFERALHKMKPVERRHRR
ncbi:MAG: DUF5677 domain-containing protein [Terriglobales bacterium]